MKLRWASGTPSFFASPFVVALLFVAVPARTSGQLPASQQDRTKAAGRKLSHDETLKWIADHKAWKLARKARPIWARPVERGEVGKEFQTADHVKEVAREGYWLCVGVAGEPWFQAHERILAKYEPGGEQARAFGFNAMPRKYKIFNPRGETRNWVAQVKGPGIKGFHVRPGYDPERPLYAPAGGFVVRDEVADPYREMPRDVWLVQEPLFKSTYEFVAGPARE